MTNIHWVSSVTDAIIMLNTDLHNPKIRVKMSQREFLQSCSSTVVAQAYADKDLAVMYRSIRQSPLRISNTCQSQRKLYRLDVPVPASSASAGGATGGRAASRASVAPAAAPGHDSAAHGCWGAPWTGSFWEGGSRLGPLAMALATATLAVVVSVALMTLRPEVNPTAGLSS